MFNRSMYCCYVYILIFRNIHALHGFSFTHNSDSRQDQKEVEIAVFHIYFNPSS